MSDLVYKAERKRISAEKQKQIQDEAILTLRKYRFNEADNAAKFVENVYNDVFGQLQDNRLSVSPASAVNTTALNATNQDQSQNKIRLRSAMTLKHPAKTMDMKVTKVPELGA